MCIKDKSKICSLLGFCIVPILVVCGYKDLRTIVAIREKDWISIARIKVERHSILRPLYLNNVMSGIIYTL